jgi:hypothetical protein
MSWCHYKPWPCFAGVTYILLYLQAYLQSILLFPLEFIMKNVTIISFNSSMAIQPFVGLWAILQFGNLFFYTDGRTP